MQTMRDAPQPHWSSRGEICIGSGKSSLFYQPYLDESPAPDPWEVVPTEPHAQTASPFGSVRGRRDVLNEAAIIDVHASSNLLGISYSGVNTPGLRKRFPSDRSPGPDATPRPGQLLLKAEQESHERQGGNQEQVELKSIVRFSSKGKLSSDGRTGQRTISDDISMVIRRRVVKGYGLENVCIFLSRYRYVFNLERLIACSQFKHCACRIISFGNTGKVVVVD